MPMITRFHLHHVARISAGAEEDNIHHNRSRWIDLHFHDPQGEVFTITLFLDNEATIEQHGLVKQINAWGCPVNTDHKHGITAEGWHDSAVRRAEAGER